MHARSPLAAEPYMMHASAPLFHLNYTRSLKGEKSSFNQIGRQTRSSCVVWWWRGRGRDGLEVVTD